ncbi:metallophosphoesterase [Cohnella lubricantis]|uniref:Metallophosphoesterase n=1 Tax=Cohnella lubricantis TaxID=2163172 RepID=A0A841T5W7_9BACL|nr:metallophosphoesterase [Cohnella lubricantis]MBB6676933.1 metallophosphoesterase [Cohnella lubricantis]MBP2118337.1 putative MPP superfamily phosphohydrolase [Cohnella lubricantis]
MAAELLWIILCLAALLLAVYACFIAPRRLTVTRLEIASPELPRGFEGKRIVQFSDTHLGYFHSLRRFEQLVGKMNALQPDIVVFTGDLFDGRAKPEGDAAVIPLLKRIHAPLGKFAVYGNHDFGRDKITRISGPLLSAGGFTVLVNETKRIALAGGEAITISGLDDYVRGRPKPRKALSVLSKHGFHLLLCHEPDPASRHVAYPIDVQLSGHSHGGQVALPFVGAIIRTSEGRKYVRGCHRLPHQPPRSGRSHLLLYVNRGIGMTRLPFRFGSVPELSVFTLRRQGE